MPSARFEKLEPERQETILAAAAAEFTARGYEGASLNQIIAAAGLSKGAFYYYFEDKADLLGTVVERALARVLTQVEWPTSFEGLQAETFWEVLRATARRSVATLEIDTWYMRIVRAFYRLREEPAAREATGRVLDQAREMTYALFARGRELGVVRTDLPLELLVDMHMAADEAGDRWMLRHWDELSEREKYELLEARVDLVRDMWDAKQMGWRE